MLAHLFAATLLVLSTARADHSFLSKSYKGWTSENQLGQALRFTIPDGQCSGAISELQLQCTLSRPAGVEVTADDDEPFPMIHIDSDFKFADVQRAPGADGRCYGPAEVALRLACPLLESRRRRSAEPVPLPPSSA